LEDLEILEDIGRGSGGIVKKARHRPTGRLMALKIIQLDVNSEVRKRILLELRTLYQAQSPHIVNFYGGFFTEGHIYICLELMDAGSLHSLMQLSGPFPEPVIWCITVQVLKGLVYLHKDRRLVHRDIKPSNILINTKGEVKISDFGVSGQLATSISSCVSWVGTVTYMSPERIQGRSYSTQSDVWSLGLSLLELALGRFPYHEAGNRLVPAEAGLGFWELLDKIVQKDAPELPPGNYSDELRNFISQCLSKTPENRPTSSDLLENPVLKDKDQYDLSQFVCQYVKPLQEEEKKMKSGKNSNSREFVVNRKRMNSAGNANAVGISSSTSSGNLSTIGSGNNASSSSLNTSPSANNGNQLVSPTSATGANVNNSGNEEGEKKNGLSMKMMKKLF